MDEEHRAETDMQPPQPDRLRESPLRRFFTQAEAAVYSIEEFPLSGPPVLRAWLWFALAVLTAFLVFPDGWFCPPGATGLSGMNAILVAEGGALYHKLIQADLPIMPLYSVARLWSQNATFLEVQIFWTAISAVISVLGYSLGVLLAGRLAGVAACAALFAGQAYAGPFFNVEQRFQCLILTLVANALALDRVSSRLRLIAEGCAVGISFLSRSVLCWFPLMRSLFELRGARRDGSKKLLLRISLTLVIPFLFLLPWIKYNAATTGRRVLFDDRTDGNMATGAMGIVSTVEGDFRILAGIDTGTNAKLWIVKYIIKHPLIYLSGVARRIVFVFSIYPLVLLCWSVSAVLLRNRPGFRSANLLGLYFLGVNTAFSTEERYLIAIIPLLSAISAASFIALIAKRSGGTARKEGAYFLAAGAFPPVILSVFCIFLLLRHPGRKLYPDELRAFGRAAAGDPGNAWLMHEYGQRQLFHGDYNAAYKSLGKAVVAAPSDESAKIDLARVALLKNQKNGRPSGGADLIEKMLVNPGDWPALTGREYVLKALYELAAGREREAEKSVLMARQTRMNTIHYTLKKENREEEKLRSYDTLIIGKFLPELLADFPASSKERLCGTFVFYYKEGTVPKRTCSLWCDRLLRSDLTSWTDPSLKPEDLEKQSPKTSPKAPFYDSARDISIPLALNRARSGHKRVILEVGGKWCSWCGLLDSAYTNNRDLAAFLKRNFILVKVYADQTGVPPPSVFSYPAFASCPHLYVLDSDGTLLRSQSAESFEAGEGYSGDKIMKFLRTWAAGSRAVNDPPAK